MATVLVVTKAVYSTYKLKVPKMKTLGLAICILVLVTNHRSSWGCQNELSVQAPADTGSKDPLVLAKSALANGLESALSNLDQSQKVSLIKFYERELRASRKKMAEADYLLELQEVATMYWQNRNHDDAQSLFRELALQAPNSLLAAKSHVMIGWIDYGNLGKLQLAIPSFEKALEIINQLPGGDQLPGGETNYPRNALAAQAMSTLGDLYRFTGDNEKSVQLRAVMMADEAIVAASDPRKLISVTSGWARSLKDLSRFEEAAIQYQELDRLIKAHPDVMGVSLRIGFALESLAGQRKDVSEAELIFRLEEIWFDVKDESDPGVLRVGGMLAFYYFFSADQQQQDKFLSFSQELIPLAKGFLSSKEQFSMEKLAQAYAVMQQNRLLLIHCHKLKHEDSVAEKIADEFLESVNENPQTPIFAVAALFPRKVLDTLIKLHKEHIVPKTMKSVLDTETPEVKTSKAKTPETTTPDAKTPSADKATSETKSPEKSGS